MRLYLLSSLLSYNKIYIHLKEHLFYHIDMCTMSVHTIYVLFKSIKLRHLPIFCI